MAKKLALDGGLAILCCLLVFTLGGEWCWVLSDLVFLVESPRLPIPAVDMIGPEVSAFTTVLQNYLRSAFSASSVKSKRVSDLK